MDQEITPLKLNINWLAGITDVYRQTVVARLKSVEPAADSNNKLKLYLVTDVLNEPMAPTVSTSNIEETEPSGRLVHRKAENEQLESEVDTKQLIPAEDVTRESSLMAKAVIMVFETLPDTLERDRTLTLAAISRVQDVVDDLRGQVAQKIMDAEQGEEESEGD